MNWEETFGQLLRDYVVLKDAYYSAMKVLRDNEWSGEPASTLEDPDDYLPTCPECSEPKLLGHHSECRLDTALQVAKRLLKETDYDLG